MPCTRAYKVRFTYTAVLVRHKRLFCDEFYLRRKVNNHIIVKRCCFMQLCMWFSHICRAGRGPNPFSPTAGASCLYASARHFRFLRLLYNAVHGSARVFAELCLFILRASIVKDALFSTFKCRNLQVIARFFYIKCVWTDADYSDTV